MPLSLRAMAAGRTRHDGGGMGEDGVVRNEGISGNGGPSNGFTFVSKKRRAREKNKGRGGTTARGVAGGVAGDDGDDNQGPSQYFADRLSRAWQEKLWSLIGQTNLNKVGSGSITNSSSSSSKSSGDGISIDKNATATDIGSARSPRGKWRRSMGRDRDGVGTEHEGPLSSAQRARLSQSILHRPNREVLLNSGVLLRGGLLCVLDCDRPFLNVDAYAEDDGSITNSEKQTAKTRAAEEKVRLSRPIPYLGPGFVPLPKLCVAVACGSNHTLALLQGGAVWLWGKNDFGQLGFPAAKSQAGKQLIHEPRLMRQLQGVECIRAACGVGYCVTVTAGGGVYTWGSGASGQLGTGNFPESRYNPVRIEHRRMWVSLQSTTLHSKDRPSVCCGSTHTGIRSVRGDLWIWGNNSHGQVTGLSPAPSESDNGSKSDEDNSEEGDGSVEGSSLSKNKTQSESKESGPEAVCAPMNALAPRAAAAAPSLKKMSSTILSTMSMGMSLGIGASASGKSARRRNSALAKAKKRDSKKLLILSPGETIAKMVLGANHTVILTSHGAIWGWGDSAWGQLGDGQYHRHHHHHHHRRHGSVATHSTHHHHHGSNHQSHHQNKGIALSELPPTLARRLHSGPDHRKKSHHKSYSLPRQIIFSDIGAGHAHTVAFTAAGSMWLWGSLRNVFSESTGSGRDEAQSADSENNIEDEENEDIVVEDTPRLVETFAHHKVFRGSEILCGGHQVIVSTDLGLYAIEELKPQRRRGETKPASRSRQQPELSARRISTFDGRDVQSQSLVVGPMGPRIYSIVSMHPKSGMQVLNHKTTSKSLMSSTISETCTVATEEVGTHMRFEVSLRTHYSVYPTTRRGIIQKANNLALYCRKRRGDDGNAMVGDQRNSVGEESDDDNEEGGEEAKGRDETEEGNEEESSVTAQSQPASSDDSSDDVHYHGYSSDDSDFHSNKDSPAGQFTEKNPDVHDNENCSTGYDKKEPSQGPWMPWTDLHADVIGPNGKADTEVDTEVDIEFPTQITSSDLSATAPTIIRVLCKTVGRHWLNVTFQGEHVVGSPFEIHAVVGPPVRCKLETRQDAHGRGVVRVGVTNLLKVAAYDKFGNQCSLGNRESEGVSTSSDAPSRSKACVGVIDRKTVRLLVDGCEKKSTCFDGGSDQTMSLLFKFHSGTFLSSVTAFKSLLSNSSSAASRSKAFSKEMSLRVSIGGKIMEGSLCVRTVAATDLEDISVSVPTVATVGSAMDIKITCRQKAPILPSSENSSDSAAEAEVEGAPMIETCEEFIVSVVGPKVGGYHQSGIGGLMAGRSSNPFSVSESGHGTYSTVVWPKLPGVHMIAVQHVTHDIIESSPDPTDAVVGMLGGNHRGAALAAKFASGIGISKLTKKREAERKEVRILRQVPGSPFRVQVDLPPAGSIRRRRVVGTHMNELRTLFQRLDIDQDGQVPTSTLETEMRREGSMSRLLDNTSRNLMLNTSTVSIAQFVESLVGKDTARAPAAADEDESSGESVVYAEAVARTAKEGERKMKEAEEDEDSCNDDSMRISLSPDDQWSLSQARNESQELFVRSKCDDAVVFDEGEKTANEFEDLEQSNSRLAIAHELMFVGRMAADGENRQMRRKQAAALSSKIERMQRTRRKFERKKRQQQHSRLRQREALRWHDQSYRSGNIRMRIVDVDNPQPSRIRHPKRPAHQRPSSRKTSYKSPRMSRSRDGAWSSLDIRQEIREKLVVLQRGPYGKKIAGARRPKQEFPDRKKIHRGGGDGMKLEISVKESANVPQRPASAMSRVPNVGRSLQKNQSCGNGRKRTKLKRPRSAQPRSRRKSSDDSAIELLESYATAR